ncbi:MAG: undecaprenyl-diphosphate phosphatase [Candidatus Micrarchaeota archaeon]
MELNLFSALVLGLIQGFTEWLPISSSGHLVIAQKLLGIDAPPEFDIVIMAGTTLALIFYFRKKITRLLKGIAQMEKESLEYAKLILFAGVATALIGFPGKLFFKSLFGQPLVVSVFILLTGVFLLIASRAKERAKLSSRNACFIGVAQGIAIAPGISRSGSTIGTAMLLGINPKDAAEFSFLIGAPAMAIASGIEFLGAKGAGVEFSVLFIGTASAFVAGYASIGFFMKLLEKGKLAWFGYYCVAAGICFAIITSFLK